MNFTNSNLTLNEAGSLLLGAGLVQVGGDVVLGLILVAVGAILKLTVALLQKKGVEVQSGIEG
jgi:hypothetical protein